MKRLVEWLRAQAQDRPQKEIAAEFHQAFVAAGGQGIELTSVEPKLSKLLNGHKEGFRFFFGHGEARRGPLMSALRLDESRRAELDVVLAAATRTEPVLVVDVSALGSERSRIEAAFVDIEKRYFGRDEVFPFTILMTKDQYRWLPRTYDEREGLTKEQFDEPAQAQARARALAGPGTLVLGTDPELPLGCSALLTQTRSGSLELEIERAVDVFLQHGRLPDGSASEDMPDLEALGIAPRQTVVPGNPRDRRRLMRALADPDEAPRLELSAAFRLFLARELGVFAAPTRRELALHQLRATQRQLAETGVEARSGSEADWQAVERSARREPRGPLAFLVEGSEPSLHLLNVPATTPDRPDIHRHTIEAREPELRRLTERIADWTEDDLRADPRLDHVTQSIIDEGGDPLRTRHAQVTLLLNRLVHVRPPRPEGDGLVGLRTILAGECPAASLLPVEAPPEPGQALTRDVMWSAELPSRDVPRREPKALPMDKPLLVHAADMTAFPALDVAERRLALRPPLVAAEVDRHHEVGWLSGWCGRYRVTDQHDIPRRPRAAIPRLGSAAEVIRWLDAVEDSPLLGDALPPPDGAPADLAAIEFYERHRRWPDRWVSGEPWSGFQAQSIAEYARASATRFHAYFPAEEDLQPHVRSAPVAADVWAEADLQVALVWDALRRAVQAGRTVRVPDGRMLLDLGGHLMAQAVVRPHASASGPTRVAIAAREHQGWTLALNRVETHVARTKGGGTKLTSRMSRVLPRQLRLTGGGHIADVTFLATPFAGRGTVEAPTALLAHAGSVAAEQAREEYEDD